MRLGRLAIESKWPTSLPWFQGTATILLEATKFIWTFLSLVVISTRPNLLLALISQSKTLWTLRTSIQHILIVRLLLNHSLTCLKESKEHPCSSWVFMEDIPKWLKDSEPGKSRWMKPFWRILLLVHSKKKAQRTCSSLSSDGQHTLINKVSLMPWISEQVWL